MQFHSGKVSGNTSHSGSITTKQNGKNDGSTKIFLSSTMNLDMALLLFDYGFSAEFDLDAGTVVGNRYSVEDTGKLLPKYLKLRLAQRGIAPKPYHMGMHLSIGKKESRALRNTKQVMRLWRYAPFPCRGKGRT